MKVEGMFGITFQKLKASDLLLVIVIEAHKYIRRHGFSSLLSAESDDVSAEA